MDNQFIIDFGEIEFSQDKPDPKNIIDHYEWKRGVEEKIKDFDALLKKYNMIY